MNEEDTSLYGKTPKVMVWFTPVFDFKSFEEMRGRVKVGDTVRVRFEEFHIEQIIEVL